MLREREKHEVTSIAHLFFWKCSRRTDGKRQKAEGDGRGVLHSRIGPNPFRTPIGGNNHQNGRGKVLRGSF